MSTVIWYGAGKNLRDHEREFLEETGMPECICDALKEKQGSEYMFEGGKTRKICSLENVIGRYPDYELWLTLADHNILSCYNQLLLKGVHREDIHLFGNRSFRYGCRMMNSFCYVSSDLVKMCAHYPYTKNFVFNKTIISKEDIEDKLNEMEQWRKNAIDLLKRGEHVTSCDGCSALQFGAWENNPKITFLGVGPNFAGGTRCNCDCFYCNQKSIINCGSEQELSNYDVHRIVSDVYPDLEEICLADGEPSIMPDIDKMCDLIHEKGWAVWFNTNAIYYSEKIADTMAENPKTFIACAIDASTPKTYKEIKRVDTFDRVIENLKKYKQKGNRLFIKYILIPGVNDDTLEMDGFVRLAIEIGAERITLSQNLSGFYDGKSHELDPDMPEEVFEKFAYLIARIQEEHIPWDFQIEFISAHDIDRIEKLRIQAK